MISQERENNRENRNLKSLKALQNQSLSRQQNLEELKLFDHSNDSNFESYNQDHVSCVLQQHHYIFDITENVDSVYSLQFMMDKNTNENENLSEEKMKLIRYTIKKRKELNKRKSKGRGKNFSNEEDQRLLNCVKRKGPKFHKFFRQFPGKTPNMLKNRYYKQLRFAWDHISDKQNHHFNFLPKEQMAIIQKDFGQFKKEDIEKLQLFPEAKKLLSNFLGCLSSVFININSIFLQENIQ